MVSTCANGATTTKNDSLVGLLTGLGRHDSRKHQASKIVSSSPWLTGDRCATGLQERGLLVSEELNAKKETIALSTLSSPEHMSTFKSYIERLKSLNTHSVLFSCTSLEHK